MASERAKNALMRDAGGGFQRFRRPDAANLGEIMNTAITNDRRTALRDAFDDYKAAYERCYHAGCRRSVTAEAEFKTALADYHVALKRESEATEAMK